MAMRGSYALSNVVKVERLSRGVSTENVEAHVRGDVTVEVGNELMKIFQDPDAREAMQTIAQRMLEAPDE